tara:strand:- start:39 stop:314 length:276 start_codon:yes stop_codon:yes gene_type:complete
MPTFLSIVINYPIAKTAVPYQMVPPSQVVKNKISTPLAVKVGAVAAGQSTDVGHVSVALPPFVTIRVNEPAVPEAGGFVKVNVCPPDNVYV